MNESRACPAVITDANLITHTLLKGTCPCKHAELTTILFSSDSTMILSHSNTPCKRHNSKRESVRRKCEREMITICC